jgi:hypothetical protein
VLMENLKALGLGEAHCMSVDTAHRSSAQYTSSAANTNIVVSTLKADVVVTAPLYSNNFLLRSVDDMDYLDYLLIIKL